MKKTILFIAVAVAVVIGCTNELMDTSYESVMKEALNKGDHPLVFNAYVGSGMAQTRATVASEDLITAASMFTSDRIKINGTDIEALTKCPGVFAYYTGSDQMNIGSVGIFENSTSGYTAASDQTYHNGADYKQTKFLDNVQLQLASSGSSNFETYLKDGSGYSQKNVYWPTKSIDSSTSEYMSFFAYYPHVNTSASDYEESNLKLIDGGDHGLPALDYEVATAGDNFPSIDLMAAAPLVDQEISTASSNAINLNLKHLLAAVTVHIKWDGPTDVSETPELFFTRAEMLGANNSGDVTEETMFRKRGIFSFYTGSWHFSQYFEPLNLLGCTALTETYLPITLATSGQHPLFMHGSSFASEVSDFSDFTTSYADDNYMLIIPNSYQEALKVNLNYKMKNGSYFENVDISKTLDLRIEPGKYYQILLKINKAKMTFEVTVENWGTSTSTNPLEI